MPRRWPDLLLVVLMLAGLAAQPAMAGGRVILPDSRDKIATLLSAGHNKALVIGISEFRHGAWPSLDGVPEEVARIAAAFEKHNFDVAVRDGSTLTKQGLVEAVQAFLRENGGDARNRLVVYIATHGYGREDQGRQKGYIIANDTLPPDDPGFAASAYSVDELSADLNAGVEAQHVFLFFNSCFSGGMVPAVMRGSAFDENFRKADRALSRAALAWTLKLLSHNARMVLTAGNDLQEVPDRDNPFSKAVVAGLDGAADGDGDGLILGLELATYVRARVAQETRANGFENDPVFAIIPKEKAPANPRPDAPPNIDPALQGDFVFLSPNGARDKARAGVSESEEILDTRNRALGNPALFTECADCPVMVEIPETPSPDGSAPKRMALGRFEVTYAEWDACFRELRCSRYIPDHGGGRGDRPVGDVTWQDTQEFLVWAGSKKRDKCEAYRLPTAAEWGAAAVAGLDGMVRASSAGTAICKDCGTPFDGSMAAAPSFVKPAGYGLYNMFGNLWEWVGDGPQCSLGDLANDAGACADGSVVGGSFATAGERVDAMARPASELDVEALKASMPRTSNARPYSLPTVGFRIACDLVARTQ